ncbi:RNA-binding cell elongation regulator Jag/EloR [Bacillus andreraoultii]|uniref:RNA-binding cell elongation regulator Jag/EloR n=1 Tax=Bacillus andreraoultii TaxID=1499685 RepID=UPI00053AF814|nr:RNA-binding cell elongation regulator Jag/EloR [Bacillus andreraoultii]
MREITATGQSVEEAIQSGLAQLHVTKEQVEINIIDEGKKGIFGIFGTRPSIVKLTIKINPVDAAKEFLTSICKTMDIDIQIESKTDGKHVLFQITSDKAGLLIGKRGQTLNALQLLTQLVLNKNSEEYMTIRLDAENYREKREASLIQLANRIAARAIRENKEISLEPMPSFERKVIHAALATNKHIKTYSEGTDPHRHLVISPK